MARIKPEDMTTLNTAAAVKTVAEGAEAELEEMQVAHLINEAANCGQMSVVCPRPISAVLQTKLSNKGYTLTPPAPLAKPGDVTVIGWEDAE